MLHLWFSADIQVMTAIFHSCLDDRFSKEAILKNTLLHELIADVHFCQGPNHAIVTSWWVTPHVTNKNIVTCIMIIKRSTIIRLSAVLRRSLFRMRLTDVMKDISS